MEYTIEPERKCIRAWGLRPLPCGLGVQDQDHQSHGHRLGESDASLHLPVLPCAAPSHLFLKHASPAIPGRVASEYNICYVTVPGTVVLSKALKRQYGAIQAYKMLIFGMRIVYSPTVFLQLDGVADAVMFLLSLSDRAAIDEIRIRRRASPPF